MEKLELEPKEVFSSVGYQFDLKESKFRPTLDYWQPLNLKIQKLLTNPSCRFKELMFNGPFVSYRKASPPRLAPHEAN